MELFFGRRMLWTVSWRQRQRLLQSHHKLQQLLLRQHNTNKNKSARIYSYSRRHVAAAADTSAGNGGGRRCRCGSITVPAHHQKCKYNKRQQCRFSSSSVGGGDFQASISDNDRSNSINSNTEVIDVTSLAESMRREVRLYTQQYSSSTTAAGDDDAVRLVGILANDSTGGPNHSDAEIYSNRIAKTFAEDGIDYELHRCSGVAEPTDVEAVIRRMNDRSDVHGILVFYPVFKDRGILHQHGPYLNKPTGVYYKTYDDYLRDVVIPSKDVEGLGYNYNARWLFRARGMNRTESAVYIPCTVLAVLKILAAYHSHQPTCQVVQLKPWIGLKATIINRSEIFGRPLAALLALQGATVYSVDENSILCFMDGGKIRRCDGMSLEECLFQSNVVVSAVPSSDFSLPTECISPGTTVIGVTASNVDEVSLLKQPNVKLVPSIGKVTCAALEQNLCRLHRDAITYNDS